MTEILDVSIGPVQEFVSQSRRTRDLWGSSYLLAYLSAHALNAATAAGARVIKPNVSKDPLFAWIRGDQTGDVPAIGSVPNHFTVEVSVPAQEVASACTDALNQAWRKICDAVWDKVFAPVEKYGYKTEAVWRRQVDHFWEIMWVACPAGDDQQTVAQLRSRRKQWRAHLRPPEIGSKCMMMHNYQELSGFTRVASKAQKEQRQLFWDQVRNQLPANLLRADERLCAVAAVKRLFPEVAQEALGWPLDLASYRSTVDLAVQPWLERVAVTAPEQADSFRRDLWRWANRHAFPFAKQREVGCLADVDPNYFYEDVLDDDRLCPLNEEDEKQRTFLKNQLVQLQKAHGATGAAAGTPPNAYALVLADGDQLGDLARNLSTEAIGEALQRFTQEVPHIVSRHEGQAIYAGGDDVLAMVPVPQAIACAEALAVAYDAAFETLDGDVPKKSWQATLSAAVVLAHIRVPITLVLEHAHHMLDDVAKEGNGRNSLAVSVLKRGGARARWVSCWQRNHDDETCRSPEKLINALVNALRTTDGGGDRKGELATSLLFRLRETLAVLCDGAALKPGDWVCLPPGTNLRGFLLAEILRGFAIRNDDVDEARAARLTDLLVACLAPAPNGKTDQPTTQQVGMDGLLTACFLAHPEFQEVRL